MGSFTSDTYSMKNTLISKRLILSAPNIEDFASFRSFLKCNQEHLKRWETLDLNSDDEKEQAALLKKLSIWIQENEKGQSARFFLRPKDHSQRIIGQCNFTQIYYGAFQACYLGYKIDGLHEGKGLMFEALQTLINFVFQELKLHRIMANYMPVNIRSAHLLQKLKFSIEGYAKNYLLINGKWEDHVLTALSAENWHSF